MEDFWVSSQSSQGPGNYDVISTRDSIIEEIRINRNTGYVTISYGVIGDYNVIHMELVTLVVTSNTIIRDRSGRNMSLMKLREGMVVDTEFSSAMTMSIPPQARAYTITVVKPTKNTSITVDRVLSVDLQKGFLYTGNAGDIMSQMRFVITNTTLILDRNGDEIPLRSISAGQKVRIEHANFQTRSIPPQTTAIVVQIV